MFDTSADRTTCSGATIGRDSVQVFGTRDVAWWWRATAGIPCLSNSEIMSYPTWCLSQAPLADEVKGSVWTGQPNGGCKIKLVFRCEM